MGKKIVIDACVAIDLNIPKINFLGEFLSCCNDDQILISSTNYGEIHDYTILRLLENSDNVEIIDDDNSAFDNFYSELKSLRLGLGRNDGHVLFRANESNAEFIVSSDFNVYDKARQFKKIKSLSYMNPMTTVTLLAYIYEQGKIGYSIFLDKTLRLYKYKEIDNMLEHLSEEDLNVSKPSQKEIIDEFKQSMKERFQDYKEPLITEFRHLLALGRLPT
ncbi:hypothetical protein [Candidatus Methanoperedens nitratireducens]|uniref:Uncharacterized protein n=1 Tax=Candidatus Methanoperedens nitratireducens TaxID=1392998 RepID=A0A284VKU1_9EURY|nr:hypothetical protein [Candidatus Methanoperedens nitroreducens]SNQ59906.1 hypothetical protein MNV_1400006 [Candidatus Methanoperedens nitroreducens]